MFRELKESLNKRFDELADATTDHAFTESSKRKISDGAMFTVYVIERGDVNHLFCGFFVSPRIALTVNHDNMFSVRPLELVRAIDTQQRRLTFFVESTDSTLDFTVLRLDDGCADSGAWFSLPTFASVQADTNLGLVTMRIGPGKFDGAPPRPRLSRVAAGGRARALIRCTSRGH